MPNPTNANKKRSIGSLGFVVFAVAVIASVGVELSCCRELHAKQDELDRQLYNAAPKIVDAMLARGCEQVGVLKFRVKKGGQPASSNAGTLNATLSERLTKAIILAAKRGQRELGVIANANSVAKRGRASHLRVAGRKALLAETGYEPAWQSQSGRIRADGFLTGVALTSSTLESLRVVVLAFDRFDDKCPLAKVADFTVPMTAEILAQLNETYVLRGGFEGGKITIQEAAQGAVAVRKDVAARFPLGPDDRPIRFEILYDGLPQKVEFRDGRAFVAEPRVGQKVTFALTHDGSAEGRFGAVLKINGENSIQRERQPNINCSKWILSPSSRTEVAGYQKRGSLKVAEDFKILSEEKSAVREFDYGVDVGTITVAVFREATQRYAPEIGDEAEDLKAIGNAALPEKKPDSLAELQATLRISVGDNRTRGLITPGENVTQEIRRVEFEADPVPVATVTIHYYKPKKKEGPGSP